MAGLARPVCALRLDASEMEALGIDPEVPEFDSTDDYAAYRED